jgi:hypothetical protein
MDTCWLRMEMRCPARPTSSTAGLPVEALLIAGWRGLYSPEAPDFALGPMLMENLRDATD